jgi:polysaccharide chain length determinant protein (PEP-CTERM system associated)
MPGKSLTPADLLRVVRRRKTIFIPFVLITLAAMVVMRQLPDRYRSQTLIMVVPQQVPERYVRSTVTTRFEDRLRTISQQMTSRTRLEPIIKEFNLYPTMVRTGLIEDVVERMRLDIDTEIIRGDAFRISYVSDDPRTAMKVTERLASMYIDESLRDREVLADSTNQFLDSQLAAAKERLIEHEKKLEAYKSQFSGELPAQVQANLQAIQNAQMQIQSLVDSIGRDRDRRSALESQLADLGVSPDGADPRAPAAKAVQGPVSLQLAQEQKTLDDMRLRLKPTHPDVLRQQRVVKDLERRAADETAVLALVPAAAIEPTANNQGEVARLSRIAQLRAEVENVGSQITHKEQEEARLRSVVSDYQARVEAAPARESELVELMRDYDTLQTSYKSLLTKKEEAQVAANLERHQIGEQFKILDPARVPERPFSPNRPLLYTLSVVVGLGCGLLLAGFAEFRDTSLKTDTDVVALLELPVLAMIPELLTNEMSVARTRRQRILSWGTAGAVAACAVAVLVWVLRS